MLEKPFGSRCSGLGFERPFKFGAKFESCALFEVALSKLIGELFFQTVDN